MKTNYHKSFVRDFYYEIIKKIMLEILVREQKKKVNF